jgi:hypothetical protein
LKKEKNDIFVYLGYLYREFYYDNSIYIYIYMCVYYILNWFIPSIFLLSTLVPLW